MSVVVCSCLLGRPRFFIDIVVGCSDCTSTIHFGGRPLRVPRPSRSRTRMASSVLVRSSRNSVSILSTSILRGYRMRMPSSRHGIPRYRMRPDSPFTNVAKVSQADADADADALTPSVTGCFLGRPRLLPVTISDLIPVNHFGGRPRRFGPMSLARHSNTKIARSTTSRSAWSSVTIVLMFTAVIYPFYGSVGTPQIRSAGTRCDN